MAESRPLVRLKVVAYAWIIGGFGVAIYVVRNGEIGGPTAGVEMLAFGIGLFLLALHWVRSADVGGRGMLGCVWWLVLAVLCGLAIMTNSNH